MKKIISVVLASLLLAAALVGCSGGASDTASAPAQEPAKVEQNTQEPAKEEPKAEEKAPEAPVVYKDGSYEGTGEGMHTIKVAVEVAGGKIAKVEIKEHEESDGIADKALEQIPAAIVEKNSTDVEVVSGATLASEGIMNAVKNALEAAK